MNATNVDKGAHFQTGSLGLGVGLSCTQKSELRDKLIGGSRGIVVVFYFISFILFYSGKVLEHLLVLRQQ